MLRVFKSQATELPVLFASGGRVTLLQKCILPNGWTYAQTWLERVVSSPLSHILAAWALVSGASAKASPRPPEMSALPGYGIDPETGQIGATCCSLLSTGHRELVYISNAAGGSLKENAMNVFGMVIH
jgi:hypothetical protein